MRIRSTEQDLVFEIFKNAPGAPLSDYTIRTRIKTQFGDFSGENKALYPSAFPQFLRCFGEFIETRQGEVTLTLTEGSEVVFFRWNGKGDVGLRFKLCRYVHLGEPLRTSSLALTGEFPLDSEWLHVLRDDLVGLAQE